MRWIKVTKVLVFRLIVVIQIRKSGNNETFFH